MHVGPQHACSEIHECPLVRAGQYCIMPCSTRELPTHVSELACKYTHERSKLACTFACNVHYNVVQHARKPRVNRQIKRISVRVHAHECQVETGRYRNFQPLGYNYQVKGYHWGITTSLVVIPPIKPFEPPTHCDTIFQYPNSVYCIAAENIATCIRSNISIYCCVSIVQRAISVSPAICHVQYYFCLYVPIAE